MGLNDLATDAVAQARRDSPRRAARRAVRRVWTGTLRSVGSVVADGRNVYDREWDLLVVLDACRVDAMEAVADEYEFVESVASHPSPGSNSPEWLERTFSEAYEDHVAETAYVTANPHSEALDETRFDVLDEVWRYAWDPAGTVRPTDVTDRVVDVARTHRPPRLVAHYMQPHDPFRVQAYPEEASVTVDEYVGGSSDGERSVYDRLRDGDVSREAVWRAYCDTLRWALDSVETLLSNVDAERVVVTADHGELFGEWGCYCHPRGVPVPTLRQVPWVETTAQDERTYEPRIDPDRAAVADGPDEVEARLRDLGYR